MLGTVFSAALAVAVSAQSAGQTPDSEQNKSRDTRSQAAQTVTVTGCLKAANAAGGSEAGAPTPGTPNQRASGSGYILTDATSSTGTAGATPGTPTAGNPTATSGATSATTATSYRLSGSSSEFTSLVGKRVEVKGSVQNRSGSSSGSMTGESPSSTTNPTGSTAGGSQSSRTGSMSGMGNMPQLRVTSVKEVPGSCSSER